MEDDHRWAFALLTDSRENQLRKSSEGVFKCCVAYPLPVPGTHVISVHRYVGIALTRLATFCDVSSVSWFVTAKLASGV